MLINVYHKDMANEANKVMTKVAVVNFNGDNVNAALDYAYRWTNNIEGSWSRKVEVLTESVTASPGEVVNHDLNDDVEVQVPLHEVNGEVYGLRSTSMFDELEVVETGARFRVAMVGFEKV